MRAVNLIPVETRRTALDAQALRGPGPALVGVLAVVLALVTIYVLTSNSISTRQAELSSLRQQLAQTQAASGSLVRYSQFTQLAQTRTETVREIAASRFDWSKAMSELADVVPANTTLESLQASVDSSASASSSGASGSGLRSDINVPAFELVGCTASQDDVARLMSRLRLINGVTRVTLSDSVKDASASSAASSSTATPGASCGAGAPTFDVVVFFQPPAAAPVATTPASTTTPTTTTPATTTPPATTPATTTTPAATTPPAATGTTPAATPASSSTGGGS